MRCPAALIAGLFLLGCSDNGDRPPVVPCSAPECHGTVQGSGASGGSGSGDGGAPSSGTVPVFGVTRLESDDFSSSAPFPGGADVRADGEGGTTVLGSWNGVDPFALAGLSDEPFVLVEPQSDNDDALPTLLAPSLESPVELSLVRATVMDSILALSSLPLDLDAQRAQIVLIAIDLGTNLPLAGLTLVEATSETVLYAASGGFSDTVAITDLTGLSVLVNVDASPWPGRLASVAVSGAASGAIPLRAVTGAVTLLVVGIER